MCGFEGSAFQKAFLCFLQTPGEQTPLIYLVKGGLMEEKEETH